ncbi:MAG: ATP-binding protein [Pseudomonadota bacterium]
MADPLLQSLVSALPFPALAVDTSERIAAANDACLSLIGPNARDMNFVTILRQPMLVEAIEGVLSSGAPRDTRYLGNDGARDTTFRVSCRAMAGVGQGGNGAVLVTFEDISLVEDASQMRRDFVANVSHELRTPLTSIMGFIETLRGPARNDPAAAERFLDTMQVEAARMNRLVGDLMSLNRVERDERVRPTETVVLGDVVTSTLRTLRHLAEEASVSLDPQIDGMPISVLGDADQLKQVITNLIENAIKYGGAGGKVKVVVAYDPRDPALRGPAGRIEVIDFGPGIDPLHLPRLTERFYRSDDHRSRALGGTGLGLAIVKHIVNRHRGRLRTESELGQGARFTVILPAFERVGVQT